MKLIIGTVNRKHNFK